MGLQDYWKVQGEIVAKQFSAIRRAHKDADVKGGRNEASLASVLEKNLYPRRVLTNAELIDSEDVHSDEVDLVICNEWQPFNSDDARLLIAEGVDAVVQIKARLTSDELKRCFKNAASVKALRRKAEPGARVATNIHDAEHFVARIPYFCVAFDSALSVDSVHKKTLELAAVTPSELQPDGVIVIDKCVALNLRGNEGAFRVIPDEGQNLDPWGVLDADAGLSWSLLLWAIYITSTQPERRKHPLMFYQFWNQLPNATP